MGQRECKRQKVSDITVVGSSPSPPWIELPEDVTFNIMQRLGAEDLLCSAQQVCSTWWKVCKDPSLWRVVDFSNPYQENSTDKYAAMYRSAVDRSQGQLVELTIHYLGDDTLMEYIAHRSPYLKRLHLESCHLTTKDSIEKAVAKLGELEELHLTITIRPCLVGGDIIVRGNSRPTLKSFSYNGYAPHHNITRTTRFHEKIDYFRHQFQLALNRQMHAIRMLDWRTNNEEFEATILNACPHLKSLDIRTNSLVQYL